MPVEFLSEFLSTILFVFLLGAFFYFLTARSVSPDPLEHYPDLETDEEPPRPEAMQELSDEIGRDEELLASVTPLEVPHIDLPGAVAGGGATNEACSKASGRIDLKHAGAQDERREYNRRLSDRRKADAPVADDRRALERRIWLRREEDRAGKKLLTVTDAADTIGVPVEQIYKWLDKEDIPFYQVTDGGKKAIRFEVDELVAWYSVFISSKSS